jgi:hypothetical protein
VRPHDASPEEQVVTIAISLKVNDGVVLAADSASTLTIRGGSGPPAVHVYDNAEKIVHLHARFPVGAITWGAGAIGLASTSTLLKDFRAEWMSQTGAEDTAYSVAEVAERLRDFMFVDKAAGADLGPLGFIVAGYDADGEYAHEYVVASGGGAGSVPGAQELRPGEAAGVTWNGQTEAVTRLIFGFSQELPEMMATKLNVPKEQVPGAIDVLKKAMNAQLVQAAMPIQDAVDLARFLVEVTIGFVRFNSGAPTAGGPIEIAAITKHEGFQWIERKRYYS